MIHLWFLYMYMSIVCAPDVRLPRVCTHNTICSIIRNKFHTSQRHCIGVFQDSSKRYKVLSCLVVNKLQLGPDGVATVLTKWLKVGEDKAT